MKIHFLRNATMIIHAGGESILVDPMLSDIGEMPPFSFFRYKAKRNPMTALPDNAAPALENVTTALITHFQRGHSDHLDRKGARLLRSKNIPTYCRNADALYLKKKGLNAQPLSLQKRQPFLNGHITVIPTKHGYSWISALMGPGVGYIIELPGEPSIYISGDTIITGKIRKALDEYNPDIAVVAAGSARLDIGPPLLMTLEDVLKFTELAPGRVIANHLEALNHCPTTREQLSSRARDRKLQHKLDIPEDGEIIEF